MPARLLREPGAESGFTCIALRAQTQKRVCVYFSCFPIWYFILFSCSCSVSCWVVL